MPLELSPTARALRALEVLQGRPDTTADELAARLAVTERAARRYVGILREAGVDVRSTRGRHGGYRLGPGTRLPPVVFTGVEALGLVMAVLEGRPTAGEGDDLVGAALDKVIRALPERVGREARALHRHAAAVPDRAAARCDPRTASALIEAVAARRRVRITYRGSSQEQWETEVDPWAVVARHGRWYLLCHSHRAGATRSYRIDRVRDVVQTATAFEPPEDLDPVAALERNLGAGWAFSARVVIRAPLQQVAPWIRAPMGRLEDAGSHCVLVGSTGNPAMYAQEWLAALPFAFVVEGGPELRAAVASVAARLGAAVADPA